MCLHVQRLFIIIRKQLMDREHPLNELASEFVKSYLKHYEKKIE